MAVAGQKPQCQAAVFDGEWGSERGGFSDNPWPFQIVFPYTVQLNSNQ